MKLVSFGPAGAEQPGVLVDDQIAALAPWLDDLGLPGVGMNGVLGLLATMRSAIEKYVSDDAPRIVRAGVRLGPPVPHPPSVIVIGGNFHSHVQEMSGMNDGKPPQQPIITPKPSNTVTGPYDDIVKPPQSEQLDYESEMAVVIGKAGRNISRENALEHIAGYMNIQDMTLRDQILPPGEPWMHLQMGRAKGFDGSSPCGPWLLTADEVADPHDLEIRMWVNDELRQHGSTSDMVVDIPGLIESLSAVFKLRPGDVLITGTPAGVGAKMDPPQFLLPGDRIRMTITGLGETANTIVAS